MFGQTGRAFDPAQDAFDGQRARVKSVLERFRENVGMLISTIPRDMPGYTVHDLSHLDALWEMADLILGDDVRLNPAEAFVLGGAILLHDAGMTVAAYPGGRDEVERTPEYASALAAARSQLASETGRTTRFDEEARDMALIEALRSLHSRRAEVLATLAWTHPVDKTELFLLDDAELRSHYGSIIGRIAHSHHWGHSLLQKEFSSPLGAATSFPASWVVDPLKIALILRCADAAHLDGRRAPRILHAMTRPSGVSAIHWSFQEMIAKPMVDQGKLLYTSTSDFDLGRADAWQLAFDTFKMVDGELRAAEDINIQRGYPRFVVDGVLGAASARQMSQYIKATGWQPVELSLRVTDVPHLARTLGGKDLYSFELAPLRELIQNAADAVDARIAIDQDFEPDNGEVLISIQDDGRGDVLLEVNDNGVGMSERVLTGALLDFGLSFWRSADARAEFPSLHVKGHAPRGRYGIGFFSIFMWCESVEVLSRRFSDAAADALVLSFRRGLGVRPILRRVDGNEISTKWSTRVRLSIPRAVATRIFSNKPVSFESGYYYPRQIQGVSYTDWPSAVRLLCATLPLKVEVSVNGSRSQASCPNWKTIQSSDFYEFFWPLVNTSNNNLVSRFSSALTDVRRGEDIVGRAFIVPNSGRFESYGSQVVVYDKGIFAGNHRVSDCVGVLEGRVTNAARESFETESLERNIDWIRSASQSAFSLCSHPGEELAVQRAIFSFGYLDESRPLFILNREVVSSSGLLERIKEAGSVRMHLSSNGSEEFQLKAAESLSSIYGLNVDPYRAYALVDFDGMVGRHQSFKEFVSGRDNSLVRLFNQIMLVLGPGSSGQIVLMENKYQQDYLEVTIAS